MFWRNERRRRRRKGGGEKRGGGREEECKEIREKARRGQREEDKIGGKSTVMEKIVEGDE